MLEDTSRSEHLQPQEYSPLLRSEVDVLLKSPWFVDRWTDRFRGNIVVGDVDRSVGAIMARILGDPGEAEMMVGDIRQGLSIGYEEERGVMSHADLIDSADELRYMVEEIVKRTFQE